jgi:hypothetical protein
MRLVLNRKQEFYDPKMTSCHLNGGHYTII